MRKSKLTIKCPVHNKSPLSAYSTNKCRCNVCIEQMRKYTNESYKNDPTKALARAAKYRKAHPDRIKATRERSREYMKNWWITHTYKIKLNEYQKMQTIQNNECYLCGQSHRNGRKLYLDHDHKTGKVRKLLCCRCNTTIGLVNDNIHLLNKMIDYIDINR